MFGGFLKFCLKWSILCILLGAYLPRHPVGLPVRAGLTIVWFLACFCHFLGEDRTILARWRVSGEKTAHWKIRSVGLGSWKMCIPVPGVLAVLRPKKNRARANRKAIKKKRTGEEHKFGEHLLCYPFLSGGSPVLHLGSVTFPPLCTTVVKAGIFSVAASFEYSIRVEDPAPLAQDLHACERLYSLANSTLRMALHKNFAGDFGGIFSNKNDMTVASLKEWQKSFNEALVKFRATATCSLMETTVIPYAWPYEEYRPTKEKEEGDLSTEKLKDVLWRSGFDSDRLDLDLLLRALTSKARPEKVESKESGDR